MNTMHLSALLLIRLSVGYESVIGRRSSTLRQSILRLADGEQSTVSARNMLAAVQMTSTNDKIANLQTTIHLVERAAKNGAIFVSLPECSSFPDWMEEVQKAKTKTRFRFCFSSDRLDRPQHCFSSCRNDLVKISFLPSAKEQ